MPTRSVIAVEALVKLILALALIVGTVWTGWLTVTHNSLPGAIIWATVIYLAVTK